MLSPLEAAAATGLAETILKNDKEALLGFRGGARIDWGVKYSMTEVRTFITTASMLATAVHCAELGQQQYCCTIMPLQACALRTMRLSTCDFHCILSAKLEQL